MINRTSKLKKSVAFTLVIVFLIPIFIWKTEHTVGLLGFAGILAGIVFVSLATLTLLKSKIGITKSQYTNAILLICSVVFVLTIAELGLRFLRNDLRSYGERNGNSYYSSCYHLYLQTCESCTPKKQYYTHSPNSQSVFTESGTSYEHKFNTMGLRDDDPILAKDSNEYRIIGVGDSFTEGVGTDADSTWLKQLADILNHTSTTTHYTTLNAGVQGNDVIFSYQLFKDRLLRYEPDLVILNLNSTDINDIIFRGGIDRFDENGVYQQKNGPQWEYLFGASYLVRLVSLNLLNYNWQLLNLEEQHLAEQLAIKDIGKTINQFQSLAKANNFSFLLITHPLEHEINNIRQYKHLSYNPSIKHIELETTFDSIYKTEPTPIYYWPIDGHFTTKGYHVLAQEIYSQYFKNHLTNE